MDCPAKELAFHDLDDEKDQALVDTGNDTSSTVAMTVIDTTEMTCIEILMVVDFRTNTKLNGFFFWKEIEYERVIKNYFPTGRGREERASQKQD